MKKMMMALAVAAILPSCNKDDEPNRVPADGKIAIVIPTDSMENHATITFGCSTTTTAIKPMTRATLSSISLTDLWVYDLPSGQTTPTMLAHQTASDADFGAPTITAEYGDHTFYFVASRGDTPTIDGTTISWSKPSDTFWSSLTMTVAPSTSASQSVTLHRVAARLRVTITDEIPTGLAVLSVTPSHWYYGLDITTGEATDDRQTARTVNVPASYIGTTGQLAASFFTISPSTQWTTDVTLKATGTDNSTLSSISIKDVPMQRNHVTSYGGSILNAGRSVTLTSDDQWIEDDAVTW
jgi:hypothetical protein